MGDVHGVAIAMDKSIYNNNLQTIYINYFDVKNYNTFFPTSGYLDFMKKCSSIFPNVLPGYNCMVKMYTILVYIYMYILYT